MADTGQLETAAHPPPIPHVTSNITSLAAILRKFAEFAFTELSHVLSTQPNDELKKKKLLELIVHLRKEFVRLYVLVKWSRSSSVEFTTLIDLFSFVREQVQYFVELGWHMMNLNEGLLGAKMPNPDIVTALEVLKLGRPVLPSHGMLKRETVSTRKVLKTLRELNVLLTIKFALVDDMPLEFINDYVIRDGRIYVTTRDYSFQLSVLDEESSFVLIDFQFNKGEYETETIPQCTKLKKVANEVLKRENFKELAKILKNYNNTIKFYIIHLKLQKVKNIKHQYYAEKFLIVLNYWVSSFVFKNSFIEIGLNKDNDIIYRWFKSGKFVKTFKDIDDITIFLKDIQFKHTQEIHSKINELQIHNSLLQLNSLTGLFYFKNSTPFLNNSLKKLNLDDFKNINDNIRQIKLTHRCREMLSVLTVTRWQTHESQKLSHQDLKRLLGTASPLAAAQINNVAKSMKFFSLEEWPLDWRLMVFIDVNEIRAFMGTFKDQGLAIYKELKIEGLDYRNSKEFVREVTEEFVLELIAVELSDAKFKLNSRDDKSVPHKSGIFIVDTKSFVEVLYCSEVCYLKYEILSDLKIKISLHAKLFKNFANLNIPELNINNDTGTFNISELFDFRQTSTVNFLKAIYSKLTRLSKGLELIDILHNQEGAITLISINLNEIVFSYSSDANIIKLKQFSSNTKTIEFNDANPHKLCQLSIQEYLNRNGISQLVTYLTSSIPLFNKLHSIGQIQLGTVSVQVIPKTLNTFTILYFHSQTGRIIRLEIQIIKKVGVYMFLICVECSDEKDKVKFNDAFRFKKPAGGAFGSGVLLLNDSVYCGVNELEGCIDGLNRIVLGCF